jgi:predicted phage tail component-like protein
MIGSFSIDGIESSDYSLVCKSVKRPLLPAMKVQRVEVNGLSGAYDFGDDEYGLRQITMRIAYIGTSYEELRTRARSIAAWLYTDDWKQLIINDESDKYYLVRITSEIDLKSLFESGTADIIFDCQPFAISVTEETVTELSITDTRLFDFENPGTRHINYKSPEGSKFLITIDGSYTSLSISVNGNTINLTEAVSSKTITIDSIEMEVKEGSTSKFSTITGDTDEFFKIIPGTNYVSVSGVSFDVDITIEYKPLWL